MKLSQIFGKQVFSLYEGEIIATISGASFNNLLNKIEAFKVFDKDDNEFKLYSKNIKAIGDSIIITNKNKLNFYSEDILKTPMFKIVIGDNANDLGKIIDAEIDGNGKVLNFITDANIILKPENLYIRKDFIYHSEAKVSLSSFRPKKKKIQTLSNIKATILHQDIWQNINSNFVPKRFGYNPESLLGKIAKEDLFGSNNELIVKTNQIITEKILSDATRHNRLNQLYYIAV